jgi:hypothetical protein
MSLAPVSPEQVIGVNIPGVVDYIAGNVVGRDEIIRGLYEEKIVAALEAEAKLAALKQTATKGNDASDLVIAKLVGSGPAATSAVGNEFGTPIPGALAGPATGFVLDKPQHK